MKFFSRLAIVWVLITFLSSSTLSAAFPPASTMLLLLHLVRNSVDVNGSGYCTSAGSHSFECSKNHIKWKGNYNRWYLWAWGLSEVQSRRKNSLQRLWLLASISAFRKVHFGRLMKLDDPPNLLNAKHWYHAYISTLKDFPKRSSKLKHF